MAAVGFPESVGLQPWQMTLTAKYFATSTGASAYYQNRLNTLGPGGVVVVGIQSTTKIGNIATWPTGTPGASLGMIQPANGNGFDVGSTFNVGLWVPGSEVRSGYWVFADHTNEPQPIKIGNLIVDWAREPMHVMVDPNSFKVGIQSMPSSMLILDSILQPSYGREALTIIRSSE